eukprot:gene2354-17992_t
MGLKWIAILLLVAAAYAEENEYDEVMGEESDSDFPEEIENNEDEELDSENNEDEELEDKDEDPVKDLDMEADQYGVCKNKSKYAVLSTKCAFCYCKLAKKGKGSKENEAEMTKLDLDESLDEALENTPPIKPMSTHHFIKKLVTPFFGDVDLKLKCHCTKKLEVVQ